MVNEFVLGCLQGICIIILYYFIKWSLKIERVYVNPLTWKLQKDAGHVAWSDEWLGIKYNKEVHYPHFTYGVGDHDLWLDLSEVNRRMWTPLYMRGGSGADWSAKKLTLWERFRIWFWRIRHFHWRF